MCFVGLIVTSEGRPRWAAFRVPLEVAMLGKPALIDDKMAAYYTARPSSTIRRWAAEGRITRYKTESGETRYDVFEFVPALRHPDTSKVERIGGIPSLMEHIADAA